MVSVSPCTTLSISAAIAILVLVWPGRYHIDGYPIQTVTNAKAGQPPVTSPGVCAAQNDR